MSMSQGGRQRNTVISMKHNRIFISVAMAALVLVSLCAVGASTLTASAAQGSSNVQAPTLVGAPVGAGAPGVCSVDGKVLDLFIRGGSDNALYLKISPDGITWPSTSKLIGGVLTAPPAATSANGVIQVFVRGTTGAVYQQVSSDGGQTWLPFWRNLGGQVAANKGPAATSWVSGGKIETTLFVTGTNNRCYYMTLEDNKPTSGWQSLGGILTSAPAATALSGGGEIGLFVAGTNGNIYYNHFSGSPGRWSGWNNVGGTLLAGTSPAAYNWGTSHIGWFVTGTNSKLYHSWVGRSTGYENLGGVLTSSPSATSKSDQKIDVFARGSNAQFAALYQISFGYPPNTGAWGTWTAIGGV
jgi:hypothetical protein